MPARIRFPDECYRNPTWRGLAWLARDLAIYALVLAAIAATDHPLLLALLWPISALAISGLFILGHDAAHGALFTSERMNGVVGRLAMLPALHVYEAWRFGHNRVHHGHTLRRGRDFVWEPLDPESFRARSRARRLWHRVAWSWAGAGLYYLYEIWWKRMIRFTPPTRLAAAIGRDRALVAVWAALQSGIALGFGFYVYGSGAGALWSWFELVAVPFVLWNHCIGAIVHVHHIAPEIPWRDRGGSSGPREQIESTTLLAAPRWLNAFLHNIFVHAPHHIDVRIPFWNLPAAARALRASGEAPLRERPLRLRDYLAATRTCKLFDYERGVWVDYAGRPAVGAGSG
jgi:omega-6 fatty acid desaturase (delta-12 desaturase)